jgi:hypothetical protein
MARKGKKPGNRTQFAPGQKKGKVGKGKGKKVLNQEQWNRMIEEFMKKVPYNVLPTKAFHWAESQVKANYRLKQQRF